MLYDRIIHQGTLDDPDGKLDPGFTLPATVNWMKALRILIEAQKIDLGKASEFYSKQGKRNLSDQEHNTVFEQLFLSLHHLSALEQFREGATTADYARVGILAWYYGIANAASAMMAAQGTDRTCRPRPTGTRSRPCSRCFTITRGIPRARRRRGSGAWTRCRPRSR